MKRMLWVGLAVITTAVRAGGFSSVLSSPGETIGSTYYPILIPGNVSRWIVLDEVSNGGLHVVYMKSDSNLNIRNVAYKFNDRSGSGWSSEYDVNTSVAGSPNIAVFSDGRAVVVFHQSSGGSPRTACAVDVARGAGVFLVTYIDTGPTWPHVGIGPTDVIQVATHYQARADHYRSCSTDGGGTFTPWVRVAGDTMQPLIPLDVIASRTSGNVAIAWSRRRPVGKGNDIVFILSTDHGATWGSIVNVTQYQPSDTVRASVHMSGVYDNRDNLHLVWEGVRTIGDTATFYSGAIFHWCSVTGIDLVSGRGNIPGTFWWDIRPPRKPSLSVDASGNLFCVWTGQIEPWDTTANDLYGRGSVDNGATWGAFGRTDTMIFITDSHSYDDDEDPSITMMTTDSVRILFIDRDTRGGTPNLVKYLAVKADWFWPPTGAEEKEQPLVMPGSFELGPSHPNPAKGMAEFTYALPVAREVDLSVYNVQGQLVKRLVSGFKTPGYHSIAFDASRLPAGVYLYRLSAGEFTQTRTMVVVR